jgi:hypothetical protein
MIGYTVFNGYQIRLLKDMPDQFLELVCDDHFADKPIVQHISSGKFSDVFRFRYENDAFVYKRFLDRGPFEPLKTLFRGNRAQRSLVGDMVLQTNGFLSPHGILIGKNKNQFFTVTKSLDLALNLIEYIRALFSGSKSHNFILKKRKFTEELGKIVGKMHASGIRHGDLRWGNIFIHDTDSNGHLVYFIDNERTRKFKKISNRARLKNLVQMNLLPVKGVTNTDRLRFFNAYLEQNPNLVIQKRQLLKKILIKTEKRFKMRGAKYPSKDAIHG